MHEAVTGSGVIDELGQGRAVEALTRDDVGEDANGAGVSISFVWDMRAMGPSCWRLRVSYTLSDSMSCIR